MPPSHRRPHRGRDIHEEHRVSTPLELLFDLTFVIAIALLASQLHHGLAAHQWGQTLTQFALVFFSIWWAWMGYSWFASAYDNDDNTYRLLTMLQMAGVLILATGIQAAFKGQWLTIVLGYLLMRVALVVQWVRAGLGDPLRRTICYRYAAGISVAQVFWIARLVLPSQWMLPSALLGVLLEMTVPVWAERVGATPWHAHHISERYGLMTIIVLGECMLGASNSVASVLDSEGWTWSLAAVGLGSLGLVFALWWMYFLPPSAQALHHHRDRAWGWGYGHFFVFAAVAAIGAGLEVVADTLRASAAPSVTGHAVMPLEAITFIAIPLTVYVVAVWLQSLWLTRTSYRQLGSVVVCLACIVGVVLAVKAGLALAWALPLLCVGPAMVVCHGNGERILLWRIQERSATRFNEA